MDRKARIKWLTDLLSWVLPAVIFFGLWIFVIRRFGQGARILGKLRDRFRRSNRSLVRSAAPGARSAS